MEAILNKAGLKLMSKTKVGCPLIYSGLTEGIKSFMGTGPAAAAINNANEKTVKETIAKALMAFHLTEDIYHLQNHFLIFISQK
jgi:hypothetical protein